MNGMYPPTAYLDIPELLGPHLSPTGTHAAFLSNETGQRELYVVELETGALQQLTENHLRGWAYPVDYVWDSDGSRLLVFTMVDDNPDTQTITAFPIDGSSPEPLLAVDSTFLFNEDHLTGRYVFRRLSGTRLDLASGETEDLIDRENVNNAAYSPDGQMIAFDAGSSDPDRFPKRDNYVCDEHGDNVRHVIPGDSPTDGTEFLGWHPTERILLVHDHTNERVGLFVPDDNTTEWITSISETDTVCGFGGNETILLLRDETALRVTFSGEVEVLGLSNIAAIDALGDTIVAITTSTTTDPPALVTRRMGSDTQTIYQTEYGPVIPERDNSDEERLTYKTPDGDIADIIVHHATTEPAPAVAFVYTPYDSPYDGFPRWFEYLVHRGFTVVRPQIPSGKETDAAIEEIAAVGRWLCERSWVDDDRIAVFGHSSGGRDVFMQLLARDTSPWAAGIARNGVTDLRDREQSGTQFWLREQIGSPEENPDDWARISPIEHADTGLAAPLRIHHACYDTTVQREQARTLRDALCVNGYVKGEDFEYQELSGQGHVTSNVYQNAAELTMIVDFLDRRL